MQPDSLGGIVVAAASCRREVADGGRMPPLRRCPPENLVTPRRYRACFKRSQMNELENDKWLKAVESVPQSEKLTLHQVGEIERPFGLQTIWVSENRQYKVKLAKGWDSNVDHPMAWLSIIPLADAPLHDWRIMQAFKNQLCGEECCGVEIYPAEEDLLDANNIFHLWVWLDGFKPPFGFRGRSVVDPASKPADMILATPQRAFAEPPKNTANPIKAEPIIRRLFRKN